MIDLAQNAHALKPLAAILKISAASGAAADFSLALAVTTLSDSCAMRRRTNQMNTWRRRQHQPLRRLRRVSLPTKECGGVPACRAGGGRAHPKRAMRPHTVAAKTSDMTMSEPPYYEIRVAGVLGESLLSAFPALRGTVRGGATVLCGLLPDQAALHGVLRQIESLGLELLDVQQRA